MTSKSLPLTNTNLRQSSALGLVLMHLLPGALGFAAMLVVGAHAARLGLPPGLAVFSLGLGSVLIPFQLGFLLYQGRKLNGRLSLQGVVLYREAMPWWQYPLLMLPIFAWLAFIWYIVRPPLDRYFIENFFSWMPTFFFEDSLLNNLDSYAQSTLLVMGIMHTLTISVGGAIEELYFRGYLLPRMEHLGRWAPAVNMLLFSLYHFWSPWQNLARLLAMPPLYYTVWRKRNVYLAVLVHFIINLVSGISLLTLILR